MPNVPHSVSLAPYFNHEEGAIDFSAIDIVFSAKNTSILLVGVQVRDRFEDVVTLIIEALARLQDPVYGCVSHILALQQQVSDLQAYLTLF